MVKCGYLNRFNAIKNMNYKQRNRLNRLNRWLNLINFCFNDVDDFGFHERTSIVSSKRFCRCQKEKLENFRDLNRNDTAKNSLYSNDMIL